MNMQIASEQDGAATPSSVSVTKCETHSQIASFIWGICNLLRGPYKRNEYRKVILPLTVLRRFDCVLAPSKADVLKAHAAIKANPEPDADLRDTETVPLKESIEAYFKREVLPHVPDAWIDTAKTKVGYEIPLNRHFYRYEPPRPLETIETDIKRLEGEIVAMLKEVTA